jgi:hypothetical protein
MVIYPATASGITRLDCRYNHKCETWRDGLKIAGGDNILFCKSAMIAVSNFNALIPSCVCRYALSL